MMFLVEISSGSLSEVMHIFQNISVTAHKREQVDNCIWPEKDFYKRNPTAMIQNMKISFCLTFRKTTDKNENFWEEPIVFSH